MSKYAVILLLIFFIAVSLVQPIAVKGLAVSEAPLVVISDPAKTPKNFVLKGDYLLSDNHPALDNRVQRKALVPWQKILKTVITAYTSAPEETKDYAPGITASGSYTRFGVAASNFLPIGTKIQLPKLFGDRIFVVEDRLNNRYNDRIDIWMPSKERALNFGLRVSEVQIF